MTTANLPNRLETACCIVGGGPAGMMLGLLLARAGVEVVVLEKHADFFRDFRGDTIHPSTLQLMYELGYLDEFLKLPHQEIKHLQISIEGQVFEGPDFSHLKTKCQFIALMPQWDFLNFIAAKASRYPTFQLHLQSEATALIEEDGRVVGVRANTPSGPLEVRAQLVVAADGRSSTLRQAANLVPEEFGVPIDVLWFRVKNTQPSDIHSIGRIQGGQLLVTLERGDYYQCGLVVAKGQFDAIKARGLAPFRAEVAALAPFLTTALEEITTWDQVKLLAVQVNRLPVWHQPGLLLIGDAAHAMSPAGGVGVNLAIQDAVATANLLYKQLLAGSVTNDDLAQVQQRREWPAKSIQAFQVIVHRRMFGHPGRSALAGIPWPIRKLVRLGAPLMRRLGAHVMGIGLRPEHIATPEIAPPANSS